MKENSFLKKVLAVCTALILSIGLFGCQKEINQEEITVYMPDGAPALALAKLMHDDTEEDGVTYKVVKSDLIAAQVSNQDEEKNADFCVLPLTAAAKLLGKGDRYCMLGAVTHGNIYIISQDATVLTSENISLLQGKRVGVLQINNVPGLVFKTVLEQYDLEWSTASEDDSSETVVTLEGISSAGEVLKDSRFDYYVLAEPAVSLQVQKKNFKLVGDLQNLYGGENGYPQAVLVAKKDFVTKNKTRVQDFVTKVAESADWLEVATGEEIVQTVTAHLADANAGTTLVPATLTTDVLSRCGVRYVSAKNCSAAATALLQKFLAIQPNVTAIPQETFYCTEV